MLNERDFLAGGAAARRNLLANARGGPARARTGYRIRTATTRSVQGSAR